MDGVDCSHVRRPGLRERRLRLVLRRRDAHVPRDERLLPDDSTMACGTAASCMTCPAPADPNAEAVCTDQPCGTPARPGYPPLPGGHGACVADNAVASSCGSSCTACPAPASNGMAACDNVANPGTLSCRVVCNTPGFCQRGPRRRRPASRTTPSRPAAPPAPPARRRHNGSVTCNGTSCVPACNTNFHLCGTGASATCAPTTRRAPTARRPASSARASRCARATSAGRLTKFTAIAPEQEGDA